MATANLSDFLRRLTRGMVAEMLGGHSSLRVTGKGDRRGSRRIELLPCLANVRIHWTGS